MDRRLISRRTLGPRPAILRRLRGSRPRVGNRVGMDTCVRDIWNCAIHKKNLLKSICTIVYAVTGELQARRPRKYPNNPQISKQSTYKLKTPYKRYGRLQTC